jgi:autophagy-related protein 9
MAAIINLVLCPFIVIYFVLLYFFRYFNEYKSNPSSILGLRQYTPYAEWKLREFNELSHFFIRRLHLSIGPANTYINQFPRGFLVVNMMTLVNFILGAITAILVIMGLWFEDEDHSFWSFEITEGKSALFYISLFGSIWAVSAGSMNMPSTSSVSAENANTNTSSFFYDPEASLRYISQFTHYLPSTWNGRLHTMEVKNEFCELYSLKIVIIMNEILSLILTPFILWFKVSNNSGTIIDFFREYSIHVDGLGYICYFSMFNFEEKDKNMMYNLNKRKKHSKMKKKIYQILEQVELDAIKPKIKIVDNDTRHIDKINENLIASEPDDDEEDEEEDNDDDFDPLYRDEKMIRSYMYFLESYGNKNQSNSKTVMPPGKKLKPVRTADPTPSLLIPPNIDNQLTDSYTINYKFDEDEGENFRENGKKSGVFGMLNQFYKQDPNR